jgi:hypothetical protein
MTMKYENLTAAFQALLLYSIIMLFSIPQNPSAGIFDFSTLASLHEVGFYVSEKGLVHSAETTHARPCWNEWIQICCRRRTLMALYCFEGMYHTLNNLPTFPCTELGFLLAPAGKVLWGARTQDEWGRAYNRWLGHWAGVDPFIVQNIKDIQGGPELDSRAEMWLEEADEFRMLFMSMSKKPLVWCPAYSCFYFADWFSHCNEPTSLGCRGQPQLQYIPLTGTRFIASES